MFQSVNNFERGSDYTRNIIGSLNNDVVLKYYNAMGGFILEKLFIN